jgi:glycine cleavage system H protein
MNYPKDYYFTHEHEWVNLREGEIAYIGLTELALKELGEIKRIEIQMPGQFKNKNQVFGKVTSERFLTKLIMPFNGIVLEINSEYCNKLEMINEKYCQDHWLIKVKTKQPVDTSNLLSIEEYKSHKTDNLLHMIKYLVSLNSH